MSLTDLRAETRKLGSVQAHMHMHDRLVDLPVLDTVADFEACVQEIIIRLRMRAEPRPRASSLRRAVRLTLPLMMALNNDLDVVLETCLLPWSWATLMNTMIVDVLIRVLVRWRLWDVPMQWHGLFW